MRLREHLDRQNNNTKKIIDETARNYYETFPDEKTFKGILPNSFLINKPKEKVGGDGYWIQKENDSIFLIIFNCFGNGHLASIMTRIYAKAIKECLEGNDKEFPSLLLMNIHENIKSKFESKENLLLSTAADFGIVKINMQLEEMEYAGAKINLFEVDEHNHLHVIKADRMQIGDLFDFYHEYKTNIIDLKKKRKSNFYLMSDGIKDLVGGPGKKKFGLSRLKMLLEESNKRSIVEQKNFMKQSFSNWMGSNETLDDALIIGFNFADGFVESK